MAHRPQQRDGNQIAAWSGDEVMRRRVASAVSAGAHQLAVATASGEELLAVLQTRRIAAVVVALGSSSAGEHSRLARLHEAAENIPLVLVAGSLAELGGGTMRRLLRSGVKGIVLESDLEAALAPTLDLVLLGEICVPEGLSEDLARPALSHREKEILTLVAEGFTNSEIAARLYLSESTVKSHLTSSFRKLAVSTRAQAAKRALEQAN